MVSSRRYCAGHLASAVNPLIGGSTMRMLIILSLLLACSFLTSHCGATVYVDQNAPGPAHDGSSWDTAFLTIQAGVTAATPGGEVWVADGTYAENVVMGEGVQLYGGFLGAEPGGYETSLEQRDYATHIPTIDGSRSGACVEMAIAASVDGFTIVNGSGKVVGSSRYGGGVYCESLGDSGTIANNTISDNATAGDGGGVYCGSSSPEVIRNTIKSNSANWGAGIYCESGSHPTIVGNDITGNSTPNAGGGICCTSGSSPDITRNSITANTAYRGGGVFCWEDTAPTITRNTIAGNQTEWCGAAIDCLLSSPTIVANILSGNSTLNGGGICCDRSSPLVADNIITLNSTGFGGGVYCTVNSAPILTNNTITQNTASAWGGGVFCWASSSPPVRNNIVVANSADVGGGVYCQPGCSPQLGHNDFWQNTPQDYYGCVPGYRDIARDPLFADGEIHLSVESPCIDAGDNGATGLPYQDFDGDPRACDGNGNAEAIVDIGADEYRDAREWSLAPRLLFSPGWVWFSVPLAPVIPDASAVLGFNATNVVFGWDDAGKTFLLCPDDFTNLAVGPSYLAFLDAPHSPIYLGSQPALPYEHTLPAAGFSWVGVPSTQDIYALDLSVKKGGVIRSAAEDGAAVDPWLNWNWIFWDPVARTARTMSYTGGDDTWLHPWYGYRVWANTENVTIIFP